MKRGQISINRFKKPKTSGEIFDGRTWWGGLTAGSMPGEVTNGAGCAEFSSNGVSFEKWGKGGILIPGTNNLYCHIRMTYVADVALENSPLLEVFISSGKTCNAGAPPLLAQDAVRYLQDREVNTVTLKKVNNGAWSQIVIKKPLEIHGNYVKAFETELSESIYLAMTTEPSDFYGVVFDSAVELFETMGNFRDATLYFYPEKSTSIQLLWAAAYNADSNEEALFVLNRRGQLVYEVAIDQNELNGNVLIPMVAGEQYTLVIPGYSYRNYSVKVPTDMKYMIEPAKLQFTGTLPNDATVFFKVHPGEQAYFNMKDYNAGAVTGPNGATLTRLEDGAVFVLPTAPQTRYYGHNRMALPVTTEEEGTVTYKVVLTGGQGRSAWWVDGIPNVFSVSQSLYIRPTYEPSSVQAVATQDRVGKMVNIGCYLPYVVPPEAAIVSLERLAPQTANFYSFINVIQANPLRERYRQLYTTGRVPVKYTWTILGQDSPLLPPAILEFSAMTRDGMTKFMQNLIDINGGSANGFKNYICLSDEPNRVYPSYEQYEAYFLQMADYINNHPLRAASGCEVAVCGFSRFDHGTTIEGALDRKGETWTKRLLAKYNGAVGGIVWHEWFVRNPLSLRMYSKTVEAGFKYTNNGARRMSIEQTNTSGGQSVSLYDQNTHYASVWYAGVIINSARPGKLDDVMWFPVADDDTHPKGQFYSESTPVAHNAPGPDTTYQLKPVGRFTEYLMAGYITGLTNKSVYKIDYTGVEVDMLHFQGDKAGQRCKTVFGVNKSERAYAVTIKGLGWNGTVELKCWNESSVEVTLPFTKQSNGDFTFTVPKNGIFFLTTKNPL